MSWINKQILIATSAACVSFLIALITANFSMLLLGLIIISSIITFYYKSISAFSLPVISTLFVVMITEWFIPFLADDSTYFEDGTGYSQNYGIRIIDGRYQGNAGVFPFKRISNEGDVIYDVTYTLGNDGFRSDVHDTSYKVYVFGGSFVYGEGLNDYETLPFYLWKNHDLSSKNLGFHGWGMHNALYNLKNGTINGSGSINILLTSPWHALRSACKQSWTANHPKYVLNGDDLEYAGFCNVGKENKLLSFLMSVISKSELYSLYRKKTTNFSITDEDINLWLRIIEEIHKESGKKNSKLIIAYIDAREDDLSTTSWSNEKIKTYLQGFSNEVVDVTLAAKYENLKPEFTIHTLDEHPSALANKTRAERLAPVIYSLLD